MMICPIFVIGIYIRTQELFTQIAYKKKMFVWVMLHFEVIT